MIEAGAVGDKNYDIFGGMLSDISAAGQKYKAKDKRNILKFRFHSFNVIIAQKRSFRERTFVFTQKAYNLCDGASYGLLSRQYRKDERV
jgi:hypothetical protein